jgi:hypothetical protein
MLTFNQYEGKSVSICGAGPSLQDHEIANTDQVWACNSALPYLKEKGIRVTHGLCIDQGEEMLGEWDKTYSVTYLLSSTVNPKLTEHLIAHKRKIVWFHNYCGIPNSEGYEGDVSEEMDLYRKLFPTSLQVGHGLNAVPRAVCLALALGMTIKVYGADCAARPDQPKMPPIDSPDYEDWMKNLVLYADGRNALDCYGKHSPFAEAPDIKGRRWHTRPDMVISATHLLDLERTYPGRIELIGDTLPNALRGIDENLPRLTPQGEVEGFGRAYEPEIETALEAA